MSLFLPFSYNPEDNIPTTGSYTVASGKFARAFCQVEPNGSDITINGNTVLVAPNNVSTSVVNISFSGTSYTATAPSIVSINWLVTQSLLIRGVGVADTSTSDLGHNGAAIRGGNSFFLPNVVLANGDTVTSTGTFALGGYQVPFGVDNIQVSITAEYWLKAGDQITGGRKLISVYPVINQA